MEHTTTHFGSQATAINSQNALHYTSFQAAADGNDSTTIENLKKVCVIHYDDLVKMDGKTMLDLLKSLELKGSPGLLILLLDSDRAHGGDKGSLQD